MEQEEKTTNEDSAEARLVQAEKEKAELVDLSQRLKADFVNLKKDQERVMQTFVKFAARGLIERLLPTLDSFELALKAIPKELEANQWALGVKQIKQQLDGAFKDAGVADVRAEGELFNPALHEAVAEVAFDGEEGRVVEVMQKGYTLNGEVIRAAKVKISKKQE